jgi:hypothetical protein
MHICASGICRGVQGGFWLKTHNLNFASRAASTRLACVPKRWLYHIYVLPGSGLQLAIPKKNVLEKVVSELEAELIMRARRAVSTSKEPSRSVSKRACPVWLRSKAAHKRHSAEEYSQVYYCDCTLHKQLVSTKGTAGSEARGATQTSAVCRHAPAPTFITARAICDLPVINTKSGPIPG